MKLFRRVAGLTGPFHLLLPFQTFADGTHPKEQAGAGWGTYVFIAFAGLLVLTAITYFYQKKRLDGLKNVKRPEDRELRQRVSSRANAMRWAWMLFLAGLVLTGAINLVLSQNKDGKVTMDHIHGMGYSKDGQRLMFAAHDGLRIYSQGHWSVGSGEKNDYMGFTVFDQGFYSSGHPAPGSKLKNPFGVVRSLDEGKTVEPLAYYGQIDFHLMTVGYRTQTLYVFNPQANAQMKEAGLYYSKDEGKTWTKSEMNGLTGEPAAIAAHPDQTAVVAIGTVNGAYISKDYGKSFEALLAGKPITSLSFSPKGLLYAGTYSQKQSGLLEIKPESKETRKIGTPRPDNDAVAFIAVNPMADNEISIATFNRQAFISADQGISWVQIVEHGKSK